MKNFLRPLVVHTSSYTHISGKTYPKHTEDGGNIQRTHSHSFCHQHMARHELKDAVSLNNRNSNKRKKEWVKDWSREKNIFRGNRTRGEEAHVLLCDRQQRHCKHTSTRTQENSRSRDVCPLCRLYVFSWLLPSPRLAVLLLSLRLFSSRWFNSLKMTSSDAPDASERHHRSPLSSLVPLSLSPASIHVVHDMHKEPLLQSIFLSPSSLWHTHTHNALTQNITQNLK